MILYASVTAYVAINQDRFLYQPTREDEETLLNVATSAGLAAVRDSHGEISGWNLPNAGAPRQIVVIHGGSGHSLQRIYYAKAFHRLGWDVCLFEYPGFGARGGKPGRAAFLPAAQDFIQSRLKSDSRPLFLLGESMGSGTVCAVAGELNERVMGVALVVPYARLADVAKRQMPYLPVGFMLRDGFDNLDALKSYNGRLTVVIADRDEVVGAEQGRMLYEGFTGAKRLIVLPNTTHAGFETNPEAKWWSELSKSLIESESRAEY